jgi:hypothetical protein
MDYRLKKRIIYFLKARHRKGHGIHSPFLFRLITQVIENGGYFSAYPVLKAADENVKNMLEILDVETYKPIEWQKFSSHRIKQIHKLPSKYDRLLFRLVNDFKPERIDFYGSTFGLTLMALALADGRIVVKAQVENDHFRSFCRRLIEIYEVENIEITETGKPTAADFVVIQNPLDPCSCDRILSTVLLQPDFQGVVVVSGIHTSPAMEAFWDSYKCNPAVRVTMDLFEIGLFICKKELQKEEFVLRFC